MGYFLAVPGGDKSISPNETNIVTSKNWGNRITNTVKAGRGCGNDVRLPKLKKKKTAREDKVDEVVDNVPTQSIPQNPKHGAPSPRD